ncbi:alpha/beta family hydrolase [Streptomyces sp. BI20]|uniref:alpha/beta hydrolase family protein n=1 Tax=Streptomyces sp. BI20 TaxID=3403460 RepID=UPI003C771876
MSPDPAPRVETVTTPDGEARITWHPARAARRVLALGHGAGGGIEARDLDALARALPARGTTVALVEQPWRVAGKRVAAAPRTLDTGWRALWPALTAPGLPVVSGGRSAGARVACRTAVELDPLAVLALAFPLHPPGRPDKSRAGELADLGRPLLVVQGGADTFGTAAAFPTAGAEGLRPDFEIVDLPAANHGFAVPKRAARDQEGTLADLVAAVADWLDRLPEPVRAG